VLEFTKIAANIEEKPVVWIIDAGLS
jgi:hypothetical protein